MTIFKDVITLGVQEENNEILELFYEKNNFKLG